MDLNETPFELQDAYSQAQAHMKARAIARLQDWKKYIIWKTLATFGYKGICSENYIITSPFQRPEEIQASMAEPYRKQRNEHLAHTAVCDFPAELLAIGSHITGRFTLSNTTHLTRVAALRQFNNEGVFKRQN